MRRCVAQGGRFEGITYGEVEHFWFFVDLGMTDSCESSREDFRDVICEIMVVETCVAEPSREDDEVREEVGGAEGG
jgi:hypothetical protein